VAEERLGEEYNESYSTLVNDNISESLENFESGHPCRRPCSLDPFLAKCAKESEKLTFSELSVHLSPQDVEQVSRSRHACDLHIAILVLSVELLW